MNRPWRVYYNLAYDGGGASWHKDYRTAWGATIARLWHLYVASWGGSAVLTDAPGEVEADLDRAANRVRMTRDYIKTFHALPPAGWLDAAE